MSLRGQCTICYSAFTPTTVSALPCGHTFHEQCIGQWLDTPEHGCPYCRSKCHAKDVIRIFFENGDLNDTLNVTTQESGEALLAKNKALQARLNDVAAKESKAKEDLFVLTHHANELEALNQDLQARLDDVAAKESKAKKDLSMEIDRRVKLETLNEDLQARLDDVTAKESKATKDLSMEIDRRVKLETLNKALQARLDDVAAEEWKARKDLSMEIDRRKRRRWICLSETKKETARIVALRWLDEGPSFESWIAEMSTEELLELDAIQKRQGCIQRASLLFIASLGSRPSRFHANRLCNIWILKSCGPVTAIHC
ncbi:unnamed protein product, partial [Mesorhabditis belari]|uniref:RING-type domain-containing protein n=1 Tax=Mesorhabditis belari TaxID=2138241 RepID=A0AAF3FKV9_9BILA